MLTEVENVINTLFREFDEYTQLDEEVFTREQRELKQYNRGKAAEENQMRQKQLIYQKALQR